MRTKLVIFDRDGVLNQDSGYPYKPQNIIWGNGVLTALRELKQSGIEVAVATNQSGVARGYFSEADVEALHQWMSGVIEAAGGAVTAFYHCPYHPEGILPKYRQDSPDRKPRPGMLLRAMAELGAHPEETVMVGDKPTDMEAAEAAGIRGYLFRGQDLAEFIRQHVLQQSGESS